MNISHYNKGAFLGKGSFGEVYEYVLKKSGEIGYPERVAVKSVNLSSPDDDKLFRSFKRELEVLTKVKHDNIVKLYSHHEMNRHLELVMECCDRDLSYLIKSETWTGHFSQLRPIAFQIACGVAHLHKNDIIHRDIKPKNILLKMLKDVNQKNVLVKISGFGLSRVLQDSGSSSLSAVGTRNYMSPEMTRAHNGEQSFRPEEPFKTDVFSAGVLFFRMKHNKVPFPFAQLLQEKPQRVNFGKMKFMEEEEEMIAFEDLCSGMLQWDSQDRITMEDALNQDFFHLTATKGRRVLKGRIRQSRDVKNVDVIQASAQMATWPDIELRLPSISDEAVGRKEDEETDGGEKCKEINEDTDNMMGIKFFGDDETRLKQALSKDPLGRGKFGTVFKYTFSLDSPFPVVAVKEIPLLPPENNTRHEKFNTFAKREADICKDLMKANHKNVLQCFAVIQCKYSFKLVLEYCKTSLKTFMRGRQLGLGDVKYLGNQIISGLAYLHGKNIIHRDMKSDNILIPAETDSISEVVLKICDFGLSRYLPKPSDALTVAGTQWYMAPELYKVLANSVTTDDFIYSNFTQSVDIFSTGVILYEMSAREYPFTLAEMNGEGDMTKISSLEDKSYSNLLLSMLDFDPSKRPRAEEVIRSTFLSRN